jgi:hypothetical protein
MVAGSGATSTSALARHASTDAAVVPGAQKSSGAAALPGQPEASSFSASSAGDAPGPSTAPLASPASAESAMSCVSNAVAARHVPIKTCAAAAGTASAK